MIQATQLSNHCAPTRTLLAWLATLGYAVLLFILAAGLFRRKNLLWAE